MKKLIIISLILSLVALGTVVYFINKLTDVKLRQSALEKMILELKSEEKLDYLQILTDPYSQKEIDSFLFGGQRPSNFKTTLAESLSATASTTETISVSSLTTKDGHTLVSADIGDFIAFHINPGASNDEIVACTGISGTTFTNCTRGYGFYTNAAVTGNVKAHSPGETIVISNDDVYLKTQYTANDDDETIYGTWDFASTTAASRIRIGDNTSTYDKIIYALNGDASLPFLMYDESENVWVYSNNGIDTTSIGGGASSYTAGDGLTLTASDFDVDLYTTYSGLRFVGANKQLAIATSTHLTILSDGKLYIATTTNFTWSGTQNFTGNFQLAGATLTASANDLNKLTNASSSITAWKLEKLTADTATTSQVILHSHVKKAGLTSRNTSSGTGTFTIAHGLGVTPTRIRIDAAATLGSVVFISQGYATSATDEGCNYQIWQTSSTEATANQNSTIIRLGNGTTGGSTNIIIEVSALDSTYITLNATTVNNGGADFEYYMKWEAEY